MYQISVTKFARTKVDLPRSDKMFIFFSEGFFFLMFSLQGSLMTSTVEYQEMLPLASSLQQPAVNSSDVL